MNPTDAAFLKAITTIKSLSRGPNALGKPPGDRKVQLYGWYKQATEGDVEGIMPRPEGEDPQSRANQQKWDAWKSHEGTTKQLAKLSYVEYLLETMRSQSPAGTDASKSNAANAKLAANNQHWAELEAALDHAKQHASEAVSETTSGAYAVVPQVPLGRSGQPNTGYNAPASHRRRLSAGSIASSYSHFLRNPINASPSVRNSSFSEFGLSEKDRSELHADQIVNRMQNAYPPVIPGAVAPDVWPGKSLEPPMDLIPAQINKGFPRAGTGKGDNDGFHNLSFSEWFKLCFQTVERWISNSIENVLHRLVIDTFKIFILLLILRIVASRPHLLQRSPLLRRIVNTAGKVIIVVFDGFGIELKLKTPAPVEALNLVKH